MRLDADGRQIAADRVGLGARRVGLRLRGLRGTPCVLALGARRLGLGSRRLDLGVRGFGLCSRCLCVGLGRAPLCPGAVGVRECGECPLLRGLRLLLRSL